MVDGGSGAMTRLLPIAALLLAGCARVTPPPDPPHPCSSLHYYDPGCCHKWDWEHNKCADGRIEKEKP